MTKPWPCSFPWHQTFVNNNGHFQVCCTSEEFDNNLRDEKGNILSIKTNPTTDQVMNSPTLKKIRTLMRDGKVPDCCQRCFQDERDGGSSRRIINFPENEANTEKLLQNIDAEGRLLNIVIKEADYRLGNGCNLYCRMCSPGASIRCVEYWPELCPPLAPSALLSSYSKDWAQGHSLILDFQSKLETVEKIHFAGGEPLISPHMVQLLDLAIASGRSKDICLSFNTNLTILDDRMLEKCFHFKSLHFIVSIDGIGELNDYIRTGSSWEKIHQNLLKLDAFAENFSDIEIMLSTTVQAINVLTLNEIVDYLKQFKYIIPVPNFVNLTHPPFLSTRVLPLEVKEEAEKKLWKLYEDLKETVSPHDQYLRENIVSVIHFMKKDETSLFNDFLLFQKKFDAKYQFETAKILPFLKSYFL